MAAKRQRPSEPPAIADDDAEKRYDEIPYLGQPHPTTHPDRLAVVAGLNGFDPQPIETARVLEVGCGDGANLVPMSLTLPESEFVGIDVAGDPIRRGNKLVRRLELKNVKLIHTDLQAFPGKLGKFDYIIAHGLYSWTPLPIRDALFELCRTTLTDRGVAYVSYSTNPGGHIRKMLREMMNFHAGGIEDPLARAAQARALAGFIAQGASAVPAQAAYADLMAEEAARLAGRTDAHIYHDDLAPNSDFIYFTQFVSHAARHGLQYLGEAEHFETDEEKFGEEVGKSLRDLASRDVILKEQYLDFLTCRVFRKTLLCRQEVRLKRGIDPNTIVPFYVSCDARQEVVEGSPEEANLTFVSPRNGSVTLSHPVLIAAMECLAAEYPGSVQFARLVDSAIEKAGEASGKRYEEIRRIAEFVYRSYGAGFVELSTRNTPFATTPGERPEASPLARVQTEDGEVVTSLRHDEVRVGDKRGRTLLDRKSVV